MKKVRLKKRMSMNEKIIFKFMCLRVFHNVKFLVYF